MNIKSMRLRSYRSFAVDEHVPPEAAERYRTLKAYERLRAARCNEVVALQQLGMSRRTRYRWQAALAAGGQRGLAPKSTRPRRVRQRAWKPRAVKAVMDVRRKYPFMGKARIQAMLARKGRHLSASTVGRIIERGPGGWRDPPRVVLRGTRQAQAAAPLREVGDAVEVRLQGPQAGGTLADRPHDLRLRRADAEGVPGRLSGLQVHGDAGLLAGHRRQCQTLPDGPPRRAAVPAAVCAGRRWQRVHGRVRGCLRGTAPHQGCADACTSCRPGGPNGTAASSGQTARRGSSSGASTTVR